MCPQLDSRVAMIGVIGSIERFDATLIRGSRVGGARNALQSSCYSQMDTPLLHQQHIAGMRKVDFRLPGKGNSISDGARPVHLIIMMVKWIRTGRLSIKNSLSRRHEAR